MENRGKKEILIDAIVFIFIAIFCASNILIYSIGNLDELWNYNFARNICDGLIPYKDFNMVQMPLLSIICAGILKIFVNQLLVMRLLAVIMMTMIFFISYKILKLVTNNDFAKISLLVLLVLFKDVLCIDYNYAVLLIALFLLYIELKHERVRFFENNFKYDFMLGIIAGLAILCKQTTGIAAAMACIGYKIFAIRRKEDIKVFVKIACTRLIGVFIPLILLVIYLMCNNAWGYFIDYTVLGLKTFSNSISYNNLFKDDLLCILAFLVPITIFCMFIMLFTKNSNKEIYMFFAYSVSTFIVTFPISDKIHFLIGSLITFLSLIYVIYDNFILRKTYSKNLKLIFYGLQSFLIIFCGLFMLFNSIKSINNNYIKAEKEMELSHFNGIPKHDGLSERIIEVGNYIKENEEKR